MNETLKRLAEVFQDLFEDEELDLSRNTAAGDVEGWDSLMHVTLMVRVESEFGVRFTSSEVEGLKHVGDLVDLIDKRLQSV